jgi:hypothetical protein
MRTNGIRTVSLTSFGVSVGSQTATTPRKRNPQQSGRHLVTMASTRQHVFYRCSVWDLARMVRQGQQTGELTIMPRPIDPSRDLLFGLLALQNGLINQVQLLAAFQARTLDKARAMADHLISLGHLDLAQRAVVEAMADLHVAKHGDVERSLAAIPAGRSTHERLARLGDPEIEGSLAHVRSQSTQQDGEADADRTATYSVGSATSDGLRFRVLRPHSRGGLGAVFVALGLCDGPPPRSVSELFESACCHAMLAGLAGATGSGVSPGQGQSKADKAMDLLRRAVGWATAIATPSAPRRPWVRSAAARTFG